MKPYASLHELIAQDSQSRALYERLPMDVQVALQEQCQSIRTQADLAKAAAAFEKRSRG